MSCFLLVVAPGGGGGYSPILSGIYLCAAPKGMVFEPFWFENGYGYLGNVHESL